MNQGDKKNRNYSKPLSLLCVSLSFQAIFKMNKRTLQQIVLYSGKIYGFPNSTIKTKIR